jgi:murein DD-endopeptidase MepM/ murein hydrolase activator NlpD
MIPVLLIGIGILLVYGAVKNKNPAQVVKDALRGKVSNTPLATNLPPIPLAPFGVTQVSDPLLVGGKYVRPVTGGRITARFGDRGSRWASGFHTGLDFAVPDGTAVYAVTDGRITSAGYAGAYGYRIGERLASGTMLYYAHLSQMLVTPGRSVKAGMVIARSGHSGNATGPHLHFEVRTVAGMAIDPEKWLASKGVNV